MLILRIIAQIMNVYLYISVIPCPADNAMAQRTLEESGNCGYDINTKHSTLPPSAGQDSGIERCVYHDPPGIRIHPQMELKGLLCQFLLPGLNEPGYPLHRGHFQVSHWSLQR